MSETNFTWIDTHYKIAEYLSEKEDKQKGLIQLLKSIGIGPFNDKSKEGKEYDIDLEEIDPFTFFCYLHKYSSTRLTYIKALAEKIGAPEPQDDNGLPTANAQRVWMFPPKYERTNNEIARLWDFFRKARNGNLTDKEFKDVLTIKNVAITKLTEVLFYINPNKNLPINNPIQSYLKNVFEINPKIKTYSDYTSLLKEIRTKTDSPYYQISHDAWVWNENHKVSSTKPGNKSNGRRYWLYSPGENAIYWEEFYEQGIMGISWDEIGDIRAYKTEAEIRSAIIKAYGGEGTKSNSVKANIDFRDGMKKGDVVFVKKGMSELLGYGIVSSDYIYDENRVSNKKIREVDWKIKGSWNIEHSLVVKTLTDITPVKSTSPEYKTFFQMLFGHMEVGEPELTYTVKERPKEELNYSLNTIFYGPPGTGKTYHSLKRAAEIVAGRKMESYEEALKIYKENLHDTIELITFHQNYSYEDFVQGLRPDVENDSHLTFERKDGVFKVMADRALKNLKDYHEPEKRKKTFEEALKQFILPLEESEKEEIEVKMKKVSYSITAVSDKAIDFRKASGGTAHKLSLSTLRKMYDEESTLGMKGLLGYYDALLEKLLSIGKDSSAKEQEAEKKNYVLIIDEINRANISRVFGELITLIEEDKRSHGKRPMELILPSGDKFIVPSNLYIIGTMNTADKSIALLDIALRRRFDFEPMFPVYAIEEASIHDTDVLRKLNEGIIKTKGYDFQIGHAYFMDEENNLVKRMNRKVIPLLLEYYMNDEKEVKALLHNAGLIVDENKWPLQISGRKE